MMLLILIGSALLKSVSALNTNWLNLAQTRSVLEPLTSAGQCLREADQLTQRLHQSIQPPQLTGIWTSSQCELLPQGQFALRYLQFYDSGRFMARHFRYYDAACTRPKESLVIRGTLTYIGRSLSVPGASDTNVTLNRLEIIPYTQDAAKQLTMNLRRSCQLEPGKTFPWPQLQPYRSVPVFQSPRTLVMRRKLGLGQYTDDIDCAHVVSYPIEGMSLLRMDEWESDTDQLLQKRLLLGLVLTGKDPDSQSNRRPTHFQQPLLDSKQTVHDDCAVCRSILSGDEMRPPILRPVPPPQHDLLVSDHLDGDWLSTECESHVHGMFAHRQMSYLSRARLWVLRQRYYDDPLCRHPSYTLVVRGLYKTGKVVNELGSNTQQVHYEIDAMHIIPESERMAQNFAYFENCGTNSMSDWVLGQSVDVTRTGGCHDLGLFVPSATWDIVRLDSFVSNASLMNHRNVGQRSHLLFTGDLASRTGAALPSVWRAPMSRCEQLTVLVTLDEPQPKHIQTNIQHKNTYEMWLRGAVTSPSPRWASIWIGIGFLLFR